MNLNPHDLVDFYDSRRISTGLVLEVDDRRIRILTHTGKEAKLSVNRVLSAVTNPPVSARSQDGRDGIVAALKEIFSQREAIKTSINLAEVWEVVSSELTEIDREDLSELVFGRNRDFNCTASLMRAIFEDRIYFKIKPDCIEVVTPGRVEQTLAQREREHQKIMFVNESAQFLARLKAGERIDGLPVPEGLIGALEEAAYLGREWETATPAKEIFSLATMGNSWDPFRVLVHLGVWSEDEHIRLKAERVPIEFSTPAEESACALAGTSVSDAREDMTSLEAIAIDASTTRDVDDAISLERAGEDLIVGIHITDVAEIIDLGSPLDLEIRERGTSIYLPEMTIPMIPLVLSEQAASLTPGVARPAVSLMVRFDAHHKMRDFRLCKSRIRISERLTYEEADIRINDPHSKEKAMYDVALAMRDARIAAGALVFKDPEFVVYLTENHTIQVSKREREIPSQQLVSEMMILANTLFAKALKEHHLPAVFRSQPPPQEKISLSPDFDPVESFQTKRLLPRGEIGLDPAPHFSLGVEAYSTATSPLRRYSDLVVQRQLKSIVDKDSAPLSRDDVEKILVEVSYPLERAALMERDRQRYFLLKYLQQRKGEEFEAVVLQRFPRFYLVHLYEFVYNAVLHVPHNVTLNPYDRVLVQIDRVKPRADMLTLSLVKLL
ncbi:MAG: ribonuclease catalytic domain-containing protein [Thermodesulfobacteriota bacterium]